ncbi:unnamed protein product [Phytomonas sp. EM1]|nr:unnamed protein product [Phytomonas sp. EM1]|eukprot:CCW65863.1 unnamed protein product [Phytomonas sp. isolate EM1]
MLGSAPAFVVPSRGRASASEKGFTTTNQKHTNERARPSRAPFCCSVCFYLWNMCMGKGDFLFSPYATFPFVLFTDLSVAGLPAELKHITQRRKRKQP